MFEARVFSKFSWSSLRLLLPLLVLPLGFAAPSAFALGGDVLGENPCDSVEENGYSGALRVDYMLYRDDDVYVELPTVILVASDDEFEQLRDKLRCRKGSAGLVLIEEMEWDVYLRVVRGGTRMVGHRKDNDQKVIVVRARDAKLFQD